jgi:AraC-like DNA-binding protein
MPLVVKQALATRLVALPEMRQFLADASLVSGLNLRFWPITAAPLPEDGAGEPVGCCARLVREEAGCRMCGAFRQKLREGAEAGPTAAMCDAGLWELLVPVTVGGVVAGHFLVSGLREGTATTQTDNRARHLLGRRGIELRAEDVARLRGAAPALDASRREALGRLLHAGAERLARAINEHLARAPEGVPELVERAHRIVHAEYGRRLRVPLIARRLGVSAAHLSRTFHHATGLRLVDYVARYRAERARALLGEDEAPSVAEAARACGFTSISQFNRVFRATFGASPRALRGKGDA